MEQENEAQYDEISKNIFIAKLIFTSMCLYLPVLSRQIQVKITLWNKTNLDLF